jgi:hypothetical protein
MKTMASMSRATSAQSVPGPSLAATKPVPTNAPVLGERQICEPPPTIHARPMPSIRTESRSPAAWLTPQFVSSLVCPDGRSGTFPQLVPPFVERAKWPFVPTASPIVPDASNSMSR